MFVSSNDVDISETEASKEEDLVLVGTITEEQIKFEPDEDIELHTIEGSYSDNSETTLIKNLYSRNYYYIVIASNSAIDPQIVESMKGY